MYRELYSLRNFYAENGHSLKIDRNQYRKTACRYYKKKIVHSAFWALHKKLHRVNGWHKLDVFRRNTNRGYTASAILDARLF